MVAVFELWPAVISNHICRQLGVAVGTVMVVIKDAITVGWNSTLFTVRNKEDIKTH